MRIEFDYEPRVQFLPMHTRKERYGCVVAHRRCGKTVAAVHELILRAIQSKRKNSRYGYVAPYRQQAKNIAWVYLKEATQGFAVKIRESDLRVELPNGSWISLFGADNPDALRGVYFDGVILDEFGDCRPNLWGEVILPTLADRKGWAIVMGTPKGENQFFDFSQLAMEDDDWFSLTLKASETGIIDAEELALLKKSMTEAQYDQEMECSFSAPVLGTYYAGIIETLEKRLQIAPLALYDPAFPVNVATDLGYTDSTAFWFWQYRPDGIAIIRSHSAQSQPLQYYFDYLDHLGYEFETIWLPHDAKAKTLQTGRSTVEQFVEHFKGTPTKIDIVPSLKVQHGIDAARLILPSCYFDSKECSEGITALRGYRRKYDKIKKVFSDTPLHSWESDLADAFRYFALVCKTSVRDNLSSEILKSLKNETKVLPENYTLNGLFEDRERFLSHRRKRI